jgi:hypothetical protein
MVEGEENLESHPVKTGVGRRHPRKGVFSNFTRKLALSAFVTVTMFTVDIVKYAWSCTMIFGAASAKSAADRWVDGSNGSSDFSSYYPTGGDR